MPDGLNGRNIAEQNNDFRQQVLVIASALAVFYGIWFAYDNYCIGNYEFAALDLLVAIIFFFIGMTVYCRPQNVWPRIVSIVTVSLFFFSIYLNGGIDGTGALWSFLIPPIVFFLGGFKAGVGIALLYLVGCAVAAAINTLYPGYLFAYDAAFLKRFFGIFSFASIVAGGYEYHKIKSEKVLLGLLETAESSWKQIAESEQKYRTLFDGCGHGIIIADIERERIIGINPSAAKMFGYAQDELADLGIEDLHPSDELSDIMQLYRRNNMSTYGHVPKLPCQRKDRSVFYSGFGGAGWEKMCRRLFCRCHPTGACRT